MDSILQKMSSLSHRHERRVARRVRAKHAMGTLDTVENLSIGSSIKKPDDLHGAKGSKIYDYPQDCFNRMSWVPQLRDRWLQHDPHVRLRMHKEVFGKLLKELYPVSSDEEYAKHMAKFKFDGEGLVSFRHFLEVATRWEEFQLLKLDPHGSLTGECRNHHWALLSLCKPGHIEVGFRILHVSRKDDGSEVPLGSMVVRLTFRHISDGVYDASVDFTTARQDFDPSIDMPLLLFTIMFVGMVLSEFLYSTCMLPLNIMRLVRFEMRPDASDDEAIGQLWEQILLLCDARAVRSRFQSGFWILIENLFSVLVIFSVVESATKAMAPFKVPGTDPTVLTSRPCFEAYAKADREWIYRYLNGEDVRRGISALAHIQACSTAPAAEKLSMFVQSAALRYDLDSHAVALNMLLFRLLAILDLWKPLTWISATAAVCFSKMLQFLVLYFTVVGCFSIAAQVAFGCYYMQFRSLGASFYALILFSSGHTDRALESVHPWIDGQGSALMLFLLIYTMLVAVIIMNVFTSIVLEAYDIAQNPVDAHKASRQSFHDMMMTVIQVFRGRAAKKRASKQEFGNLASTSEAHQEHEKEVLSSAPPVQEVGVRASGDESAKIDEPGGEGHGDASGASAAGLDGVAFVEQAASRGV